MTSGASGVVESLVAVSNSLYDGVEMSVESYPSREAFMGTIRESGEVPDVFLAAGPPHADDLGARKADFV